jgi:hypothetical protein
MLKMHTLSCTLFKTSLEKKKRVRFWNVTTREAEPDTRRFQQGKQRHIMECYNRINKARYWNVTMRVTEPDTGMLQQDKQSQMLECYDESNRTRYWNVTTG